LDVEELPAFPGLMLPSVRVAVPESPVIVTVHEDICMLPLFFMVAATKVFEPALTTSIDCTCMSSIELIVPTMPETNAYTVNPTVTVMEIRIIVAISGLIPRLCLTNCFNFANQSPRGQSEVHF
jgi:hypothetical protein